MKKFPFLYLLLSAITACNKDDTPCNDQFMGSLKFSEKELDVVPYAMGDRIILVDTTHDTLVFNYAEGYTSTLYYTELDPYTSECMGDYYEYQDKRVKFENKYMTFLYVAITFSDPFMVTPQRKVLRVQLRTYDLADGSFYGRFDFNEDSIYNDPDTTFLAAGRVKAYHDTLALGEAIFTHVYELEGMNEYQVYPKYVTSMFYSMSLGVVGYRMNDGKEYWIYSNLK